MEFTRAEPIDVALDYAWKKIVTHDHNYYVYVDKKHQIDVLKEGAQKLAYVQGLPAKYLFVGVYNAGVRKQDFIDDVLDAIMTVARWG